MRSDTWNGVREYYRHVIWDSQKYEWSLLFYSALSKDYFMLLPLLVFEEWFFAIHWISYSSEFLQICTSVEPFFGSLFELVTCCQYLCRKNGKTCFGIMSDIHRFWYLKWVDMENSARLPGRRDLSSGNLFWRWRSTFYWEFWHVSWTRVCWYKVAQWLI